MILALAITATLATAPAAEPLNHLAGSTSRYLLQHATNPVEWYRWGDEAFARARRENKPIFLSIGYSTCHWCRVMEEESFADPVTAKLMNDAFVSIKVDREERPDIDAAYLAVARTLTGDAGWPNNLFLTPDGKPFHAVAYLPKEDFRTLIRRMSDLWRGQGSMVVGNAEMIARTLESAVPGASEEFSNLELMEKGYRQLAERYDAKHGGFLPAPKFPAPHQLMFLLRYWKRTGESRALAMVEQTLRAMRGSALWDSRDRGFHRYATDAAWSRPHYEKMLYDQALLALAFLETYQATGNPEYSRTSREIFTWVLRDLRAPDGAFYAAQDADERYFTATDRTNVTRPAIDRKKIADWNGLMIAALAAGASILDDARYAQAAARAADAIVGQRRPFLDDHAFLAWGLLNLYEATFDVRHLRRAQALVDESTRLFSDGHGRFFISATPDPRLPTRAREVTDGAIPSGNSVHLMNLLRIARITGNPEYEKLANELTRTTASEVELAPSMASHFLCALDFETGPSFEVVISGDDPAAMRRAVFAPFVPNKVVLHRPSSGGAIVAIAPYTAEQRPRDGRTTAYVCTNRLCRTPVVDPSKVWTPVAK